MVMFHNIQAHVLVVNLTVINVHKVNVLHAISNIILSQEVVYHALIDVIHVIIILFAKSVSLGFILT